MTGKLMVYLLSDNKKHLELFPGPNIPPTPLHEFAALSLMLINGRPIFDTRKQAKIIGRLEHPEFNAYAALFPCGGSVRLKRSYTFETDEQGNVWMQHPCCSDPHCAYFASTGSVCEEVFEMDTPYCREAPRNNIPGTVRMVHKMPPGEGVFVCARDRDRVHEELADYHILHTGCPSVSHMRNPQNLIALRYMSLQ